MFLIFILTYFHTGFSWFVCDGNHLEGNPTCVIKFSTRIQEINWYDTAPPPLFWNLTLPTNIFVQQQDSRDLSVISFDITCCNSHSLCISNTEESLRYLSCWRSARYFLQSFFHFVQGMIYILQLNCLLFTFCTLCCIICISVCSLLFIICFK